MTYIVPSFLGSAYVVLPTPHAPANARNNDWMRDMS